MNYARRRARVRSSVLSPSHTHSAAAAAATAFLFSLQLFLSCPGVVTLLQVFMMIAAAELSGTRPRRRETSSASVTRADVEAGDAKILRGLKIAQAVSLFWSRRGCEFSSATFVMEAKYVPSVLNC